HRHAARLRDRVRSSLAVAHSAARRQSAISLPGIVRRRPAGHSGQCDHDAVLADRNLGPARDMAWHRFGHLLHLRVLAKLAGQAGGCRKGLTVRFAATRSLLRGGTPPPRLRVAAKQLTFQPLPSRLILTVWPALKPSCLSLRRRMPPSSPRSSLIAR